MFAPPRKPARVRVLLTERCARVVRIVGTAGAAREAGPTAIPRLREHARLVVELRLRVDCRPVRLSLPRLKVLVLFRPSGNWRCARACWCEPLGCYREAISACNGAFERPRRAF